MPFTIRRWSSFGRPVRGRCGGSSGSSRRHCRSVRSKRSIRARSARQAGPQPLRRQALGPTTDREIYAERLKRAEIAVAAIDALNRADPRKAATDMVAAHEALVVALRDNTRQVEPVIAAIKAFVAQAKTVREAFVPTATSG